FLPSTHLPLSTNGVAGAAAGSAATVLLSLAGAAVPPAAGAAAVVAAAGLLAAAAGGGRRGRLDGVAVVVMAARGQREQGGTQEWQTLEHGNLVIGGTWDRR